MRSLTSTAQIIKNFAANYGDEEYFDEDATTIAQEYLVEQKTAAGEGEEVANIEGIKKLGDYEVEITTDGFSATTIYNLGVIVEPMHYYMMLSLYDYDNNQFGFTRGDLSPYVIKQASRLAQVLTNL